MARNKRFKDSLDEGISSVARRQQKTLEAVELEIAERTGYSQSTVQHWRRGNIPKDHAHVEHLVRYCAQFGRVDRGWGHGLLTQASYHRTDSLLDELFPEHDVESAHVYLCYQRNVEPDESLVLQIAQALSRDHSVFFDQAKSVDARWVERTHQELSRASTFIIFLSSESVINEVILQGLEMAYDLRQQQNDRPQILSVRVDYRQPFPESISRFVGAQNSALWEGDQDTPRLIAELKQAIESGSLPMSNTVQVKPPQPVEPPIVTPPTPAAEFKQREYPEGTVDLQSARYVMRESDYIAQEAIAGLGVTITIKGPRQIGKSSLLIRIAAHAQGLGKQIVFINFQLLKACLTDAETFFRQFCAVLTHKLGMDDQSDMYWNVPLAPSFCCTEYVSRYLLATIDRPIVLAIDEADSIFDTDFRTDFFAMLRTWHNNRAFEPIWKQLDLALVTSTEPYYFISDLNQSPFNVGEVIELQDFTPEQIADLNARHNSPLTDEYEQQLMTLLAGHPYLVRRTLYLVGTQRISAVDLFAHATEDRGPFGDHLRSLLFRLYEKADLIQGLRQVVYENVCRDEQVFFRLRGAGLVRREQNMVIPRCQLYAEFFRRYFDE